MPDTDTFIEIREPGTGKLLCRIDPVRQLLEIRRRGVVTVIDLRTYLRGAHQDSAPGHLRIETKTR